MRRGQAATEALFHINEPQNLRIAGQSTSLGMVIGPAFVYRDNPEELSPLRDIKRY
jgi:hypothetical protein